jgi:hypothetical protein
MSTIWSWINSLWTWVQWLITAEKKQAKQITDLQDRVKVLEEGGVSAGPRATISLGPFRKQ